MQSPLRKRYVDIRDELASGDLILFSGKGRISGAIKWFTAGRWSHVGIVHRIDSHDMVLLWESTTLTSLRDVETGRAMHGVQTVPLSERIRQYQGEMALRKLVAPEEGETSGSFPRLLSALRREFAGRPYERSKLQLLRSALDGPGWFENREEDLSSFFCSELVAEAYQRMGLLLEPAEGGRPSNEYVPEDFGAARSLQLEDGYRLGPEIELVEIMDQGDGASGPAGRAMTGPRLTS